MTQVSDGVAETTEQREFRAEVRAFLAEHAQRKGEQSPWVIHWHRDPAHARALFDTGRAWQRTLFDHSLAGLTVPKEYGGRGGSAWHERIYNDEARHYDASPHFIGATITMLVPTLLRHGTDEQKLHYLPRVLSGEYAFCQLFSEPGAGSDLAGLACRAVRDGDEFVVTGQKVWNSAAQFCNWGMLLVRTTPDVPKHQGITFLLVDMTTPGIEARPLVQATGASEFNEVFLQDVRVPVANALGEVNGGWAPARTVLTNESTFIGRGSDGAHYRKLITLAERFGAVDEPRIRQDIARAYSRERILAFLGERMRAAFRSGGSPIEPALLKLFATQTRVLSGTIATAIGGPAAISGDDEVSVWIQQELLGRYAMSIGGGTDEVQRNNVAERALGLPKEPRPDNKMPWNEVPRN